MTANSTNTQRQRKLRERKRAAGLQRRTVWLDADTLRWIQWLKEQKGLTQDQVIARAVANDFAAFIQT